MEMLCILLLFVNSFFFAFTTGVFSLILTFWLATFFIFFPLKKGNLNNYHISSLKYCWAVKNAYPKYICGEFFCLFSVLFEERRPWISYWFSQGLVVLELRHYMLLNFIQDGRTKAFERNPYKESVWCWYEPKTDAALNSACVC